MTTIKEDKLIIEIQSGSPEEYRNWLIQSIAAAIRWNGKDEQKRVTDNEKLIVLGELLDELATIERMVE